jgi:hypothetical protein
MLPELGYMWCCSAAHLLYELLGAEGDAFVLWPDPEQPLGQQRQQHKYVDSAQALQHLINKKDWEKARR